MQISVAYKFVRWQSLFSLNAENIPLISFPLRGINPVTTNSIGRLTANG